MFNYYYTYNTQMQLTALNTTGPQGTAVNMQYIYAAGQDNGRAAQTIDGVLGETVNYSYDIWNRLTSATATNGSWGEQYTFDYFGNLTNKTPTAGSAPSMSIPYNPATNQPTGASYDANGNPAGNTWNVENRLTLAYPNGQVTGYSYDPWGRRVWKQVNNSVGSTGEVYFYGATGQKLETYSFTWESAYQGAPQVFSPTLEGTNMYFGGKLLQSKGVWVATDRLGSVRANSNGESMSYFPYGEERTATADNREKFATYTRDAPGQDYAMARYYNASLGAFWSPDPGGISTAHSDNPGTWNRYAFVAGDPVNFKDPRGLDLFLVSPPPGAEDCTDNPDQDGCNDPCQPNPGMGLLGTPPDPSCNEGPAGEGNEGEANSAPPPPTCMSSFVPTLENASNQDVVFRVLNENSFLNGATNLLTEDLDIASVLNNRANNPKWFRLPAGQSSNINDQAKYAGNPHNKNYNYANLSNIMAHDADLSLTDPQCQSFLSDIATAIQAVNQVVTKGSVNTSIFFWAASSLPAPSSWGPLITTANSTSFYGFPSH